MMRSVLAIETDKRMLTDGKTITTNDIRGSTINQHPHQDHDAGFLSRTLHC